MFFFITLKYILPTWNSGACLHKPAKNSVPVSLDVPLPRRQESGGCLSNGLQNLPGGNVGHVERGISPWISVFLLVPSITKLKSFTDWIGRFWRKLCHMQVFFVEQLIRNLNTM